MDLNVAVFMQYLFWYLSGHTPGTVGGKYMYYLKCSFDRTLYSWYINIQLLHASVTTEHAVTCTDGTVNRKNVYVSDWNILHDIIL